ncbi:AAA family ATPase [Lederbergia wuyishanensis]|uniref:PD-(D/E)XK endonuclease-like domain-containing protein n=1 Tax=Lederbergia wuyishanensis TaxID=1347903 RepID=A0ABU0D4M7_9BACI|nr:AAA family ATPase [Lederbergia wuyishanensis]MCJ8008096.1 AAA family ATPase [Lederbergia wuyishanensis]MDQ0343318.1 hypothetical protein [Lederbergia wuyishanensis]
MTQYSYSRVSLFNDCHYHYDLRYNQRLTEIPKFDADNPLIIGRALHSGVEHDVTTAIQDYFNEFPVLTDAIIEESMKLEILIPKVKEFLEQFSDCEFIHEYKIDHDDFIGYVDLIITAPDGTSMVMDFKYSNHIKNYMDSGQLHIYKDRLEQDGFKVKRLAYLFVPKTSIKQKKDEDLFHFRKRLVQAVEESNLTFVPIEFKEMESVYFLNNTRKIEKTTDFSKRNNSGNCFSCIPRFAPDYLEIITDYKGDMIMQLPSAQRRNVEKVTKRVIWLYGAPFTGKTTFANGFPNPIMLNTDGNIRFVDAPYLRIANEVTSTGRVTNTKLAWDIFKDALFELEKKNNEFKTVIVDLLEDTFEACRLYMYEKLGIEHEADNSFKAWDMVRTEYLSTMKRVVHLDYENIILISHEDTTKDVTKKSGDKITAIKPNLQEKAALKIAGMVDIVGRVVADDDDRRIVFKSKDYVFSGGRLPNLPVSEIELDVDQLFDVYDEANKNLHASKNKPKSEENKDEPSRSNENADKTEESNTPNERRRTRRNSEDSSKTEKVDTEEQSVDEEKPKRERRSRKTEDESEQKEEKPRRQRRERKPVEDDTPPGEDALAEEEETPKRTRRTRRTRD